jgi:protein SCO1/2
MARRALILCALAACSKSEAKPASHLDDYGAVPAFALQDQSDQTLTEDWLRGHVTMVDFVFTRCDTVCPALSYKMSRLDAQTKDLPGVQLLTFSVDPKYDTPAVLAAYATRFHADPARWRFVTGDYAAVQTLVEGALMTAMQDEGKTTPSGAPDIKHGGHILLIGPDLRIRGVYDSNDGDALDILPKDVERLTGTAGSAGNTSAGTAPRT